MKATSEARKNIPSKHRSQVELFSRVLLSPQSVGAAERVTRPLFSIAHFRTTATQHLGRSLYLRSMPRWSPGLAFCATLPPKVRQDYQLDSDWLVINSTYESNWITGTGIRLRSPRTRDITCTCTQHARKWSLEIEQALMRKEQWRMRTENQGA